MGDYPGTRTITQLGCGITVNVGVLSYVGNVLNRTLTVYNYKNGDVLDTGDIQFEDDVWERTVQMCMDISGDFADNNTGESIHIEQARCDVNITKAKDIMAGVVVSDVLKINGLT